MQPTYSLQTIKNTFASTKTLRLTLCSSQGALELGMDSQDIVDAIKTLTSNDFYKTMASEKRPLAPHFDVYKFVWCGNKIYLKFQDLGGLIVVSFKKK
jgi:hypothetical protein